MPKFGLRNKCKFVCIEKMRILQQRVLLRTGVADTIFTLILKLENDSKLEVLNFNSKNSHTSQGASMVYL